MNALYVNKQEFCASSWRSTKVILWCMVNQSSSSTFLLRSWILYFEGSSKANTRWPRYCCCKFYL